MKKLFVITLLTFFVFNKQALSEIKEKGNVTNIKNTDKPISTKNEIEDKQKKDDQKLNGNQTNEKDNTVIGVIKGIYTDGRIGNNDNIFLLIGFNDAEKIYNDSKLDPRYKEILPTKEQFQPYLPTEKELEIAKPKSQEFKDNAKTWSKIKDVPPTKEELKDILPSKNDWKAAFPNKRESDKMYERLTADFKLKPIELTKGSLKTAKKIDKESYDFFIKNSLEYGKVKLEGGKNIIVSPANSIKSLPNVYSKAYDSSQDMYYGSSNFFTGAVKWSARMFWVNIEGTYYLAVEAPAKMVYNSLKTLSGVAVPAIGIPMGAIVSASSYAAVPMVATSSTLMLGGEIATRGVLSGTEYSLQYAVRPVVVSGLIFTGITLKSGVEVINTAGKFTLVVVSGTGELTYYLVKPIVVGSYIIIKPIYGVTVNLAEMAVDTAYSTITTVSNTTWKGALYGYSGFSGTLATVGAGVVATPRFITYDIPHGISTIPFNMKYKYQISVATSVNFKDLNNFSEKYSNSKEFNEIISKLGFNNTQVKKEIGKYKSYLYLKNNDDETVIMFYIKKNENTENTVHVIFGFDKDYLKNSVEPSTQLIKDNINGFLKNFNKN